MGMEVPRAPPRCVIVFNGVAAWILNTYETKLIRRKEVVHCVQCVYTERRRTFDCWAMAKNESHTSLLTAVAAAAATDIHSCHLVGTFFHFVCLCFFKAKPGMIMRCMAAYRPNSIFIYFFQISVPACLHGSFVRWYFSFYYYYFMFYMQIAVRRRRRQPKTL